MEFKIVRSNNEKGEFGIIIESDPTKCLVPIGGIWDNITGPVHHLHDYADFPSHGCRAVDAPKDLYVYVCITYTRGTFDMHYSALDPYTLNNIGSILGSVTNVSSDEDYYDPAIYLKGEKDVHHCKKGDITLRDGKYVLIDHPGEDSVCFHEIRDAEWSKLIRCLVREIDELKDKVRWLESFHTPIGY